MTKLLSTLITTSIAMPLVGGIATAAPQSDESEMHVAVEYLMTQVEMQDKRIEALEAAIGTQKKSVPTTTKQTTAPTPPAAPKTKKTYVIGEGDTISGIAKKHGISRTDLLEANNLKQGQQIYIGDEVIIPSAPEAPIANASPAPAKQTQTQKTTAPANTQSHTWYTVRYGDTLSRISRTQGVSVTAIKNANGLRSDSISGGQRLKIPTKSSATTASTTKTAPKTTTQQVSGSDPRDGETYGLYTVQRGDTIYSLAKDFYTTQKELQRLNELKSSNIFPGDEIIVPTSEYYAKNNLAQN